MLSALLLFLSVASDDPWPADVEAALVLAGANRPEIEHALEHFAAGDDGDLDITGIGELADRVLLFRQDG